MAWSDKARAASLEIRRRRRKKTLYEPPSDGVHVFRRDMAKMLREARGEGYRGGKGAAEKAVAFATGDGAGRKRYFTNVKGAQFVDQGLKGKVFVGGQWRNASGLVRKRRERGFKTTYGWAGQGRK